MALADQTWLIQARQELDALLEFQLNAPEDFPISEHRRSAGEESLPAVIESQQFNGPLDPSVMDQNHEFMLAYEQQIGRFGEQLAAIANECTHGCGVVEEDSWREQCARETQCAPDQKQPDFISAYCVAPSEYCAVDPLPTTESTITQSVSRSCKSVRFDDENDCSQPPGNPVYRDHTKSARAAIQQKINEVINAEFSEIALSQASMGSEPKFLNSSLESTIGQSAQQSDLGEVMAALGLPPGSSLSDIRDEIVRLREENENLKRTLNTVLEKVEQRHE